MLRDQGIVGRGDAAAILEGLDRIAAEYERDGVPERVELEDIHMTVEHRLAELIGAAAGRLHTARSRNDQVATDFRLWVRKACDEAVDAIRGLQRVLVERADEHAETVMPGFTHLQVAQPVTLGHHLMAYYEMLRRDVSRFADARAADERMPARLRRARRHRLPDRPRARPPTRSVSSGRPPTASTAFPTAISRSIICPPPRSAACICRAWPKS